MKILHVINSLSTGGAEKLLLDTLPLYNNKGIKADLLLFDGTDYPYLGQLKKMNCCTIYSFSLGSVYNPIHIIRIIPYLKKYDVIHVHLFPAQYFVVLAKILSFSKTKLVFTEHSTSNRRMQNKWFYYIDQFIYSFYSKIICITDRIKNILIEYTKLPETKFQMIENGIDLELYANARSIKKNEIDISILETDKLLIQVAGFREQKDQKTTIRAMKHLPINVKLLLVGDGVLRGECEDLVNKLQLNDRVFFLGMRLDVPCLLKTADILILSSYWEGLPLSSIEGMAALKPVVASDVPGLSDVVKGAGILFLRGNDQALAQYVMELLSDKEYYNKVSKTCVERSKQYDIEKMVNLHITLYKKC